MNTTVRFPPSPTGFLHIGNLRVAMINYLFAKKNNGKIILRFDDTDTDRGSDVYKTQMLEDLQWIGLHFDETFSQMDRKQLHDEALTKLIKIGRVYECFETQDELEMKRKILLTRGLPPIYDRESLNPQKREQFLNEGRKPYYRFLLDHKEITWNDLIQGEIIFHGKNLSDPVLSRANGNYMYTFCSVVDDLLMNISHIIRGADHITNNAIQMQIFEALFSVYGYGTMPQFAHLPLFESTEGKISKRAGGFSIKELRASGATSLAIKNAILKIGLCEFDDILRSGEDLINAFDLSKYGKSQTTFDQKLIWTMNSKVIAQAKYEDVKNLLHSNITSEFFNDFKENSAKFEDINTWFDLFLQKTHNFDHLNDSDKAFAQSATIIMQSSKNEQWSYVLLKLKQIDITRKGKDLFIPIRFALTGRSDGPEISTIWKYFQVYG